MVRVWRWTWMWETGWTPSSPPHRTPSGTPALHHLRKDTVHPVSFGWTVGRCPYVSSDTTTLFVAVVPSMYVPFLVKF
jgi:hypothetical protein